MLYAAILILDSLVNLIISLSLLIKTLSACINYAYLEVMGVF
jgi:hypothetical protein